jgi:hypothetical protein
MKKKALKRKNPNELDFSIREKRKALQQQDKEREQLEKDITKLDLDISKCVGPENILKYKVLKAELESKKKKLEDIKGRKTEKEMHEYMSLLDQLERNNMRNSNNNNNHGITNGNSDTKRMKMDNRLYPPKPNRKNIFDIMPDRDAEKYKLLRAHQKRYAVMYQSLYPVKTRVNEVDTCQACGVDRNVDKEMAISVCPKCGSTRRFASHIFEAKDAEKDDSQNARQQSLSHMQKFSAQFERGYPSTPMDILETVSIAYTKFHSHDPSKVQACRTSHLLKNLKEVPKIFKRAPDRLTKELKNESIPEYTSEQLSQLLNQRNRLRTPEEMMNQLKISEDNSNNNNNHTNNNNGVEKIEEIVEDMEEDGEDKKHKKSFSNQIYMGQFGRANMMEQSRLFPHAKTTKIHVERTRAMEKECELQKKKMGEQSGAGVGPVAIWSLYPST